jgi:hypothetical protein
VCAAPRAICSNSCWRVGGGGGKEARERDCRRDPGRGPGFGGRAAAAPSPGFFFDFRLGAMAAAYATIQSRPHCGKRVDTLSPERSAMPRKPNFEFERRERDRLKALKNAEKAQAKKEARERARAENADAPPKDDPTEPV